MKVLGAASRGLHGDQLVQSAHDVLVVKQEDGVCVLLELRQGEAGVVVLKRGLS